MIRVAKMTLQGRDPLTAAELAEEAGVSASYVARLCREGRIPARKVGGAVWVIVRAEALAWANERIEAVII